MTQSKLYKLRKNPLTDKISCISRDDGNDRFTIIPINEANTDYQEYLAWVAEGNTAEEAD
tara:strand:+ start:340 stop:519 length:180 start_codon:yes stop_codon:yes gene_type:complete